MPGEILESKNNVYLTKVRFLDGSFSYNVQIVSDYGDVVTCAQAMTEKEGMEIFEMVSQYQWD